MVGNYLALLLIEGHPAMVNVPPRFVGMVNRHLAMLI
jgi:hypothetical protein